MSATLRNHSTAAFLLNSDVRGIMVKYDGSGATYLFKTLDPSIVVGDLVIVPKKLWTKLDPVFTVVKVVQVDVDPDFDSVIEYKWIASKFDPTDYNSTLDREADALIQVKRAEVRRRREELAANIFEDREAMKQIPFAKVPEPAKPPRGYYEQKAEPEPPTPAKPPWERPNNG